jgi:hypothetical protein
MQTGAMHSLVTASKLLLFDFVQGYRRAWATLPRLPRLPSRPMQSRCPLQHVHWDKRPTKGMRLDQLWRVSSHFPPPRACSD